MTATAGAHLRRILSTHQQTRHENAIWWFGYAGVMTIGALLVFLSDRHFANGFAIALALFIITALSWALNPSVGLHLTIFFALTGDHMSITWFPFNKNLSMQESLLYVSDALVTSPLELTLIFAMVCWFIRRVAYPEERAITGPLFLPFVAFNVFVAIGFLHGLATGGDARIAIFEVRGLVYLSMVYFLVTNVCRTREQYRRVMWTVMLAVLAHSFLSLQYLSTLSQAAVDGLESLGEHGSTVPMNALFIFMLATWLFPGSSAASRWALTLMAVPVGWVYVVSQRRSAFMALAVGFVLIIIALAWRQRRTFSWFAPVCLLLLAGYTAAFWNVPDGFGFGAQALKVVIAPESQTEFDRGSDMYRVVENFDLNYTIRQSPIEGLGFGREFSRPIPLPNIGASDLFRYVPHNSILWIWIKMGFFGFVATLYLIGRALMLGATRLRRVVEGRDAAVVMTATAAVAMYTTFAFVDMAWDARNMVLLGVAMAICANFPVQRPAAPADSRARVSLVAVP